MLVTFPIGVGLAVSAGRIGDAGFVEEINVVHQEGRKYGEGDAQLSFSLDAVEIDKRRVEVAKIVHILFDQRRQVQPGAGEGGPSANAHRTNDVGRVARRDLRAEHIVSLSVIDDFQHQFNAVLRGVEIGDDFFLRGDQGRIRARAQADIPADANRILGACHAGC